MENINFKKDVLPHLVAIVVFLSIILIFFGPQITGNKALHQHDVFQGRAGGQELSDFRKDTGEEGLWLNSMFSGMPGYLVNVAYKDYALGTLSKIASFGLPNPASYVFLALLCYYIMLLCFGIRPYLAIAGALVFGLTSFNIISVVAGHNSKIHAIAYMPLVVAGIRLSLSNKKLLGFGLTALALALELKANHLQITYYLLLITIGYGLAELWSSFKQNETVPFFKTIGVLCIAALLAVATNTGRLWTVYEYAQYSIRGKSELKQDEDTKAQSGLDRDYAFQYSNGIFEPLVLFIPNILGGSSQQSLDEDSNFGKALRDNGLNRQQVKQQVKAVPTYWGNQPVTAPYYSGAITFFLFLIGILFADKKYKVWLISFTILGVVLSWGKNFETINYLLFDYLPGYSKFRSVTFAIIIPIFCMPLLGMLGLEKLMIDGFTKEARKKLFIAFGASGGLALLLVMMAGMFSYKGAIDAQLANYPPWFLNALRDDRLSLLRSDAFRSFIFISVAFGSLWFHLKEKISAPVFGLVLIFLMAIDITLVGKRFLKNESFISKPYSKFAQPTEADKFILSDNKEKHRVLYLPNPFADAKTSYHHNSIGGYHGAKIRRYQDLIEQGISNEINSAISGLQSGQYQFSSLGLLNMLNTKYLIAGAEKEAVIVNSSSNGHAWFVNEIIATNDPNEELAKTIGLDTKRSAAVDVSKFPMDQTAFTSGGNILLKTKKLRSLEYETTNSNDGFAVFSEIYYDKGWKAYIDGEETEIKRANYVLRALEIPKGNHTIEFKFEPTSYNTGSTITMVVSSIIVLMFFAIVAIELKKRLQSNAA